MPRSKGGQPGNQNARKHGFYSNVLDASQKRDQAHAAQITGIDDEIALLRIKLKSVVKNDPDNLKLITSAVKSLAKMEHIRQKLAVLQQILAENKANLP